ncbi:MAG: hypothetical protein WBY94_21530 [Polyangiaceae bacterium]
MLGRLGIVPAGEQSARSIAAHSLGALDRPLRTPAELWVAVASDSALVLGAFQRGVQWRDEPTLLRRESGGPEVRVGEGTVHVALALASPGALAPCDERRIVNRSVRPLLRALTKTASAPGPANFFGRDWVSVAHRPAAWVGFAHDATTRRTLFEAFVAVRTPFAAGARTSFLGKAPGTLETIAGRSLDPTRLAEAIVEAYANETDWTALAPPEPFGARDESDPRLEPPWSATCEEAIGTLGAGRDARGAFRVGGDLLVSRDALARLGERAEGADVADLGRIVDDTLAAPGVALDGVRSLASVRDVIARARLVE